MEIIIKIADGVVYKNDFWFSNVDSNGLFKINIKTKKIEFIDLFPKEDTNARFLHKRCFLYDDRIIFVPAYGRHIDIFNINEKSFFTIPFENDIEGEAIMDAAQIGKYIYIFPRNMKCVPVRFNAKSLEISKIDGFSSVLDKYIVHDVLWKILRTYVYEDMIYFPINNTGIIVGWRPEDGFFNIYKTGIKNTINPVVKNDVCYFSVRDDYGIRYFDLKTSELGTIECDGVCLGNNTYGLLLNHMNQIIGVPSFGRYLCIFENGALRLKHEMDRSIRDMYKFFRAVSVMDEVWLLPMGIEDMYVLGKDKSLRKKNNFS